MKGGMGLLFLILLGASWVCVCDARLLANFEELNRKSDVCALCEEYTAEALDYLKDNKTQTQIFDTLHNTCLQLPSYKQQCLELVDYYAQIFFVQIASINPVELCETYYLCQSATISSRVQGNSCGVCKDTVASLLIKLNDPETKLEILETLLQACKSMEKLEKECKRMVFEYGPLALINVEKFIKTTDICTAIHACPASNVISQEASIKEDLPLLSDS